MYHGDSSFLGFVMQQRTQILQVFNDFFDSVMAEGIHFERIIELGTGYGGLSVFLGLYGINSGCKVYTIDIKDSVSQKVSSILRLLNVELWHGDALYDSHITNMVKDLILYNGTSLVLCDNGSKIEELNLYAPYLKIGDFIMVHDYIETYQKYENEYRGKIWDYCEITFSDIDSTCRNNNLKPFMQDVFDSFAWICMKKIE